MRNFIQPGDSLATAGPYTGGVLSGQGVLVERRGLWALPKADRTPPWEWRSAARRGRAASGE